MGRSTRVKKIYLSINGGKIVERLGYTTDKSKIAELCPTGAAHRDILNKSTGSYEKTVFERIDDFVSGVIVRVDVDRNAEYGPECKVTLFDPLEQEDYILTLPVKSPFFKHFVMKINNLKNTDKAVTFIPYDFIGRDNDKVKGMNMEQGEKLTWFFTKEDKHGMPPAPDHGKPYAQWSDDEKDEYTIYMKKRDRWLMDWTVSRIAPLFADNDMLSGDVHTSHMNDELDQQTSTLDNAVNTIKAGIPDLEDMPSDDLPF